MIYLLTANGLTRGGNSAVHMYTQSRPTQNRMIQNTQNETYTKIRIH